MKILMLVEHDNKTLKYANFHTLSAAKKWGGAIDVLIIGSHCDAVIEPLKKLSDIERIRVADAPEYEHQLAENTAPLIAEIAKDYDIVLSASTTYGKNILPRVAALLNVAMI